MSIDTKTLRARFQQLQEAGLHLATSLQDQANQLDSQGTPPPAVFKEELRRYREQHAHLTSLFDIRTDDAGHQQPLSFLQFKEQLTRRENVQQALVAARMILLIKAQGPHILPRLDEIQGQASDIIATNGSTLAIDQLQSFTDGQHPWNHLIRMIHEGGSLPDAEWTVLNSSIESSLGRALAVAAARGRLELSRPYDDELQLASHVSSPPSNANSPTVDFDTLTDSAVDSSLPSIEFGTTGFPTLPTSSDPLTGTFAADICEEGASPSQTTSLSHTTFNSSSSDIDSAGSVFDDIEPVSLNQRFSRPSMNLPLPPSIDPGMRDVRSPGIVNSDREEFPSLPGPRPTGDIPPPTNSPIVKSPSPLAARLLSLARFSDATGATSSLATMILNGQESDRAELLPDLILHLIHEERTGLAYHLSRCLEARSDHPRAFIPSWLIRTWAFGQSMVLPKGQLAGLLQDELQSRPRTDLRNASHEWRLAMSLFVRASTLRPAIIAPSTRAAALLRDFDLQDGCIQLYNYCSRIGAYGERIQGVLPGMFKESSTHPPVSDQLSLLRSDIAAWKESPATVPLKYQVNSPLFQKAGWSLRAGTNQRYPEAAFEWMNWQFALRRGESLISAVLEDRRSELARIKTEIEEINSRLTVSDQNEGPRLFSHPDIRAYLRQAISFAQRWISLPSGTNKFEIQNYLPQAASELRTEIQTRHEPVLAELRAMTAKHSSFEVQMAAACLMKSVRDIYNLVDPTIAADTREADPRHLLHGDLLKMTDVKLASNWEPESDSESLEEEILRFLSQPQPDWLMAFKMQLSQKNYAQAERILSLTHWSNPEREALQSVLESDRQRQRIDFMRELNELRKLLSESMQLDILSGAERTGMETRLERLTRFAPSDKDISAGVVELERVRDLLIQRREREANRIRSRLRQLNSAPIHDDDEKPAPHPPASSSQPQGWVMDFDS